MASNLSNQANLGLSGPFAGSLSGIGGSSLIQSNLQTSGYMQVQNPRWKFCPEDGQKFEDDWSHCPKCGLARGYENQLFANPPQWHYTTGQTPDQQKCAFDGLPPGNYAMTCSCPKHSAQC